MDTLTLSRPIAERTASSAIGIIIALGVLFSQNLAINAKDLGIYTGISPTINYLKDEQIKKENNYHNKILNKYSYAKVEEVEKGVHHVRMIRYYNNRPVRINVVELSRDLNSRLVVEPAIASEKLASRSKISNIAKKNDAIVAINGGYFKPQTGVPLGTLMINKKIYTGPIYDRVALGIFDDGYGMARVQLKASVDTNIGGIKIDNVNQPRMLSTHTIVYTSDWGEVSPTTPQYAVQLVIENGKLAKVSHKPVVIPKNNGFVIIGPEKKLGAFINAKKFDLNLKINPEWKDVNHIVSGGPYLVRGGEVFVDMTAQKLTAIGGRNPRTAIGYTKDGNLIMLTADGREGSSIGLTLMETAHLMREFGCVNAMNLDGGGSTVMYVQGEVVNKPQVQGGIPLSHTVMVTHKNIS